MALSYTIFGTVLVVVAALACLPALGELWAHRVEMRDLAYARELLSGERSERGRMGASLSKLSSRLVRKRPRDDFEEQLAAAMPMIAKNMQAGHIFEQAATNVGEFMDEPLHSQIAMFAAERRVGVSLEDAMNNLADRTGSRDARMLAAAVAVQAETGGAVAETIETIGAAMRRRAKTRRHVQTLTASYRMSSKVIFAIPVVVFALLALMAPQNASLLFTHPIGRLALLLAAMLDVAGMLVIRNLYQMRIY